MNHPILAIDHGQARIGTAVSDPIGILASPLETLPNDEHSLERIAELIATRQVQSIIIGLPLRMDGSEGKAALQIRYFKNKLAKHLDHKYPIELIDETLTTVDAASKLQQAGKKANQQKEIIDQAAAVEILSRYMQGQINPHGLLEDPDTFLQ